ncbi:MAG: RNA polymerase sigma-70 factor [Prolixibacteraceae bacterium]|nr:RNA polymerase sigma-70 factor [Prolixibacteraceae bacterium]
MKNFNGKTEKELIVSLQSGSITAFEGLFEYYSQKLYRFALSYLKLDNDAEDIVQEVFIKIWQNRSSLKSETSFQSYLFTIAFHAIQKNFRKKLLQQKFQLELFELLNTEDSTLEVQLNFEVLLSKLNQLINQLPARRKEIFIKRKKEGKSIQNIASEMGISEKTVENQITQAMNFLRRSFNDDKIAGKLFFLLFIA